MRFRTLEMSAHLMRNSISSCFGISVSECAACSLTTKKCYSKNDNFSTANYNSIDFYMSTELFYCATENFYLMRNSISSCLGISASVCAACRGKKC